ncbi:hypothetical protein [Rhizobium favelukesii]|uniref:hypothetical protein n=1 Tax=Rhizobium favelukesii TaxID=348824 RepID=UPI0006890A13|nr:hypothetical protein [Rhizobium favelukesii]
MNELMEILSPILGDELAKDIIAHRRGKKCPLTPRGAKALLREYQATGNPINAAEEHLNRGWQGFKAEWVMKGKGFHDPHNPMPRQETREEYLARAIQKNQDDWEGNSRAHQVRQLMAQAVKQ